MSERDNYHVYEGEIERVQEEPVTFRVLSDGQTVMPVYALGRRIYETWWENGKKLGRWTWRYL